MSDYRDMSSEDIEQEVEESRQNIGSTLHQLRSRMKPRQLASEALEYARGNGGPGVVRNIGSAIRDNPVPAALIGAGLAWLAAGRTGALSGVGRLFGGDQGDEGAYPQRMDLAAAKAYRPPRYDENAEFAAELSDEGLSEEDKSQLELEYDDDEYGDTSSFDGDGSFGEELNTRARDTARRARNAFSGAGEKASAAWSDTGSRAREIGAKARDAAQRVQERAKTVADEQPLTLALVGLAVGALLGAVVRSTAQEAELMGETSDRLKSRAKARAREGLGEASAVAERTLETVREEVNARADV